MVRGCSSRWGFPGSVVEAALARVRGREPPLAVFDPPLLLPRLPLALDGHRRVKSHAAVHGALQPGGICQHLVFLAR